MIFIWVLIAYGMTSIIVWGSIFEPMRTFFCELSKKDNLLVRSFGSFFKGLTTCMLCTGTWVGFFLGEFFFTPSLYFFHFNPMEIHWFYDGMFAAGSVWALNAFVEMLERIAKN